uniref:growth factor receptor-bound protein 10-like isoform X1 n=1 Tax=Halichoerus grypus TaxID=9711 RepID=UPI001659A756|nr:growth factor receptor-bound protein 10-like isoform X1 [Halichoerus grypus]
MLLSPHACPCPLLQDVQSWVGFPPLGWRSPLPVRSLRLLSSRCHLCWSFPHFPLLGSRFSISCGGTHSAREDDVDLEALVNDVNASLESLYPARGMQSETVPLLQNGQHARGQPPASGTRALQAQRSQPVHILAVRRLQEEDQQLRTSSLPAIPNPFPELCGPGSPPVLTRGSLPPSQAAAKQVSTRPWFERQAAWLWGQDGCAGSFLWEEGRGSVWDLLSSFFSSCYCPLTL